MYDRTEVLCRQVCALRESLLDLLEMVDRRPAASIDIPMSESDRLRRAAAGAEHREFKIARARLVIDGGKEYDSDWNEAIDEAVRVACADHYGRMIAHQIRHLKRSTE